MVEKNAKHFLKQVKGGKFAIYLSPQTLLWQNIATLLSFPDDRYSGNTRSGIPN